MNKLWIVGLGVIVVGVLGWLWYQQWNNPALTPGVFKQTSPSPSNSFPLGIEVMRRKSYPGSQLSVKQDLGSNGVYNRYVVYYLSDGLKINGLLTVPVGEKPEGGWPAIVFNHGYIPPEQYSTINSYAAYVDTLARAGYVIFKPDYRGHAESEGDPTGAYYDPGYTDDVLNAYSSLKQDSRVNPNKVGMWGHSMGGNLTFRSLVINPEIKAAVIWDGVIGSYQQMFDIWFNVNNWHPSARELTARRHLRQDFVEKYGSPSANPKFWDAMSPISYVKDIDTPIQLQHSKSDEEVPYQFSVSADEALQKAGKQVEFVSYENADHNLSQVYSQAMKKTIEFFDKYLK